MLVLRLTFSYRKHFFSCESNCRCNISFHALPYCTYLQKLFIR